MKVIILKPLEEIKIRNNIVNTEIESNVADT